MLTFWHSGVVVVVVVAFYHKICVFVYFHFFFEKVSNSHKRTLTNQKHELVASNYHRCNGELRLPRFKTPTALIHR